MASFQTETRAARIASIALFFFGVIVISLFRLQIIEGEYYRAMSEKNRLRLIYLEAPRGKIFDRKGRLLATSRLSFNCTASSRDSKKKIFNSLDRLSVLLGEDRDVLERRYRKAKPGIYHTVLLAEEIPMEKAMAIEEQLHLMPGLMIETRPIREYPYGESAAHLTGYIGPLKQEEVEDLAETGYRASDWIGRQALEKKFETYLRGESGGLQVEVNNRGQYVKVMGVKEPVEGQDMTLSVDAELQEFIQKQLDGQRGAVVVLNLQDGGVLALNSSPSYDPNLFASTRGRKDVGKYLDDRLSPMMDRAIQGQYPPGSIFKMITALAALEAHKIRIGSSFSCPGYMMVGGKKFRCWKEGGHGPQGLTDAFAHSCDVFFYSTGLMVGPDLIQKKAIEFGFGAAVGLDLPAEKNGLAPSQSWKQKTKRSAWFDGDTANYSIGQGFLQVTPLQSVSMVAVLALDGLRMTPHIVDKIGSVSVADHRVTTIPISAEYLQAVKQGMDAVVNHDTGTGRLARVAGVRVAGKTGTAETGKSETHAWFVGYAPAERPKIAMVVFLEYGGHGGVEAATIASAVMSKMKEMSYL